MRFIAFAGTMLALLAAVLLHAIAQAGRVTTMRLRTTSKEPLLTLKAGQFFLFNSHIWKTGQDATATIKRQL